MTNSLRAKMHLERKYHSWTRLQYLLNVAFLSLFFGERIVGFSSLHALADCAWLHVVSVWGSPIAHPSHTQTLKGQFELSATFQH